MGSTSPEGTKLQELYVNSSSFFLFTFTLSNPFKGTGASKDGSFSCVPYLFLQCTCALSETGSSGEK